MVVLEASTNQVERITFRLKTTSFHIDTPTTSQLCSNAGPMLLAQAADRTGVADAIDTALGDRQKPNLVHTTGHTSRHHAVRNLPRAADCGAEILQPVLVALC